ncbi:MAG: NUDIX domain-containing protein [Clostridia bacterium]|nr:NUDIX domain-containing protein [Clostridia bacterium]
MFTVTFNKLGEIDESLYTRVVCVSRYNGKWVYCRHKERETWEIPGGHIESGEDWLTAAKREMFEETGATDLEIEPICIYSISKPGLLCFAEIKEFGEIPEEFEIKEIGFFDEEPENLTYPDTHKLLFKKIKEVKSL